MTARENIKRALMEAKDVINERDLGKYMPGWWWNIVHDVEDDYRDDLS